MWGAGAPLMRAVRTATKAGALRKAGSIRSPGAGLAASRCSADTKAAQAPNLRPMPGSSHVGREAGSELGPTSSNFNALTPTSVHVSRPAGRTGVSTVITGSPVGRF